MISPIRGEKQWIYGVHPILEALHGGRPLERVLMRRGLRDELLQPLREELRQRRIPLQPVPPEALIRMFPNRNHQGIAALVSAVDYEPLDEVVQRLYERGDTPLLLILEGITDARNMGGILRSAEGLGVHAVIVPYQHTAPLASDAIRTSAGALLHMTICRAELAGAARYLRECGLDLIALTEKSNRPLYDCDLQAPLCLVLGAEDTGISPEVKQHCNTTASIPMVGKVGSLNVGVAAGIALYEAARQRSM